MHLELAPRPVPRLTAVPVSQAGGRRVVHLASHLDRATLNLLGPVTAALSRTGTDQTVVLIDHPNGRGLLPAFGEGTDIVRVPARRNPLTQWRLLSAAFAGAVRDRQPEAVHLHGLVAVLLGESVLSRLSDPAHSFYSPHGQRVLEGQQPLALLARLLSRSGRHRIPTLAIGHGRAEAALLERSGHPAVSVVEGPVDSAYFEVRQRSARGALVVSASRSGDVRCAAAFDRLAVILGGDATGLGFRWIGPVGVDSAARLRAAGVEMFDAEVPAERAGHLAEGWMFVAMSPGRGFPLSLAEAMAIGLPCVAVDTAAHRSLIHHGDTGYLCRSHADVIDRIAQLADTPSLRERMGQAGRAMARERFGQDRFDTTLFAAYAAIASPRPSGLTAQHLADSEPGGRT